MPLLFILIAACALLLVFVIHQQRNHDSQPPFPRIKEEIPGQLLNLKTTTIAERQRTYGRGFRTQQLYDILQAQAEAANDAATLEAIRTNTYTGPMPMQKPDGTYTNYARPPHEFPLVGLAYRDQKQLRQCVGLFTARLVQEPTNEFDPDAIKVIHESNIHVGYIPRHMTAEVRSLITLPSLCFARIWESTDDYDTPSYFGSIYLEV